MNRRYQAHPDPDHPMHKRIEQAVQDSEREYPRMVEMTEGDAVLILAAFIVAKDDAHVKGYHPIEARIAELAERWFPE